MFVSKELDYAVRVLVAVARIPQSPKTQREISQEFSIPFNFIALLVPKLVRSGLVLIEKVEKREVLRLGKEPASVSLEQVLEAIQGPLSLIVTSSTEEQEFKFFQRLPALWTGLATDIQAFLKARTLADVL